MLVSGTVVSGTVVGGNGRGKNLGFPTANLSVESASEVPADGVYSCLVRVLSASASAADRDTTDGAASAGTERYGATMSVGRNPTFDDVPDNRLEVFLHDFEGDLYGSRLEVTVLKRLRGMIRFDTVAELIEWTELDVAASKTYLATATATDRIPLG